MFRANNGRFSGKQIQKILFVVVFISFFVIRPSHGQDYLSDQLFSGWNEYGLQAFSNADELFSVVANSENATQEQILQAKLGRAFIVHYQMPGRDPSAAISLYEKLLDEVEHRELWKGLILGRLADCYLEISPPEIQRARNLYTQAFTVLPKGSNLLSETMLRFLTTYLVNPDSIEIRRGLLESERLRHRFEGTPFASVFHGLRAEMAFFISDYVALTEALDAQYQNGISNIRVKEAVLFRLARLCELKLSDYDRAEQYYRLLDAEVPSSQKAYFARLRADELAAGKLNSDFAPPIIDGETDYNGG